MNYTTKGHVGSTGDVPECFMIPHGLTDFFSRGTRIETDNSSKEMYVFHGDLLQAGADICPSCRSKMHVNNTFMTVLRHLPLAKVTADSLMTSSSAAPSAAVQSSSAARRIADTIFLMMVFLPAYTILRRYRPGTFCAMLLRPAGMPLFKQIIHHLWRKSQYATSSVCKLLFMR